MISTSLPLSVIQGDRTSAAAAFAGGPTRNRVAGRAARPRCCGGPPRTSCSLGPRPAPKSYPAKSFPAAAGRARPAARKSQPGQALAAPRPAAAGFRPFGPWSALPAARDAASSARGRRCKRKGIRHGQAPVARRRGRKALRFRSGAAGFAPGRFVQPAPRVAPLYETVFFSTSCAALGISPESLPAALFTRIRARRVGCRPSVSVPVRDSPAKSAIVRRANGPLHRLAPRPPRSGTIG